MRLFMKECRKLLHSVIYYIFLFMVLLTFLTQFRNDLYLHGADIRPTSAGSGEYMKEGNDPDKIIPAATESLLMDYMNNRYVTYPLGFIKVVHLNNGDRQKMALILERITGLSAEEIETKRSQYASEIGIYDDYVEFPNMFSYEIPQDLGIDEFRTLMYEADDILGGGSSYAEENLSGMFGLEPMTYEEIMAEYDDFEYNDRITNGYARLNCDYYGIFMILFVVFVAAFFLTYDRRSHMEQLIYSRKISSFRLEMTRYAALSFMMFLPLLVMAAWAHILIIKFYPDADLDHFAMYKYTLVWLLPTVLSGTGLAMLLTELFSGIAAILIQSAVWFITCMKGSLTGNIGKFDLIIRHNTNMERQLFMDQLNNFIFNRCFCTIAGILCAVLAAIVFGLKREGRFNGLRLLDKVFKHKSKA